MKDLSSYEYPCKINNKNTHSYFVANESLAKRFISRYGYSALLPVLRSATTNETQCEECIESGGRCGYDWNSNTPSCFCRHKSDGQTCSSSSMYSSSNPLPMISVLFSSFAASSYIVFFFFSKSSQINFILREILAIISSGTANENDHI